ncbi:MAG: hypothetical protein C0P68_010100 [Bacillota bacterium]|nr:hypothetical protein [Bacillota bacterium]
MPLPFQRATVIVLMALICSLTACHSYPEQEIHSSSTQPNPPGMDLQQLKDERLRLEQKLADFEKHLDQIWRYLEDTSS